jgi:iron-sulfur cluster assembly protein
MLRLTDKAIEAVRDVCAIDQGLRITATRGCSGLSYGMGLEGEASDGDHVLDMGGLKVFVDPASALWLTGAVVDFAEGAQGPGFVFENPNAGTACSCPSRSCP